VTLKEWMNREVKARGYQSVNALVEQMAQDTGVSAYTIANASRGRKFGRYDKAKAVSDYTGGVVTLKELCEG